MKTLRITLVALAALLCSGPSRAAEQAEWTLMIYMAADNNLEQAALIDLDEIEAGMPAEGVEIIVLIDRSADYAEGLGNWTDARVLRMRPDQQEGKLASEELLRLGEINTGDPSHVTNLIQFATSNFPARRYGLVLWDHGGGWQGMADDEDAGPDGAHDSLTLPELRSALAGAVPNGSKLDLIGFDMCLMAQVEIAYEVADFARFMVASQATEPGYGWPYDVLLPEFGKATAGPRRLAQNIVRRYGEFTDKASERVATQSAVDLSRMETVKVAIDRLAVRLGQNSGQHWPALARSVFWADSFNPRGKDANRKEDKGSLSSSDLLDLVKRSRVTMDTAFPAQAEFQALVDAIDSAVVDSHTSRRHKLSHGLSIYAPPNSATFNPAYLNTRFGGSSAWPKLLEAVHREQGRSSEVPKISYFKYVNSETGKETGTTSMLDDTTLRLKVKGNNLLWVEALTGQYSPEDKGHLIMSKGYMTDSRFLADKLAATGDAAELLVPTFKGNTARMEMEVSPATYTVSNGETYGFATIDATELQRGEGMSVGVLAEYDSTEFGKHQAIITFNMLTWQADGIALLVEMKDGRSVPRGIKPKPEDKVTLLFEFIPDGAEEPSLRGGTTMPWKDGLELIMSEVPNATYTTWAIAENLSGERTVASTSIRGVPPQWDVKAGFDGARQLDIAELGGVWATADGTPAFGIGERIGRSNLAEMMINREALPAEAKDYSFVVQLDTRLLPTLSLLTFDANDELLGRDLFMVLADASQPDRLWIKTMIGGGGEAVGEVLEVFRTERLAGTNTGGGSSSAGTGSSGTPESGGGGSQVQQPTSTLPGVWAGTGQNGVQVWVQLNPDGQFQQVETAYDQSMRVETWGSYQFQNSTMSVSYAGGQQCNAWGCQPFYPPQVAPFPMQLQGNTLQTPWALLYRQQ
ncbi:MAG: clostripain-related cysteine peptidase [Pseudomonadota bacterium]